MKKVLCILLAVLMLVSVIPFGIASSASTDTQTDGVPTPDLAYTSIGNAIATDAANGTTTELAKTNWSFMQGSEFENLTEYIIESVGPFGTYRFSGTYTRLVPDSTPTGYVFNHNTKYDYSDNITVYDSDTYTDITPNRNDTLPQTGVMFSVSQNYSFIEDDWFSMTYTAPQDGFITLSDPDGGNVASISKVGKIVTETQTIDCNTLCVNDNNCEKQVCFAIYKNNEKIWPTDAECFTFKKGDYYVEFPTLENISVKEGDKIYLAFNGKNIGTGGHYSMAFALNPQVEYVYPDTGDVNCDWNIDIRDLVALKKQIDKTEAKYDSIFDLFREDNKFVIDEHDLVALRNFILGKITEF